MSKLNFNINNEIEIPELVLGYRNKRKLGSINAFDEFSYENYLKQANTISLKVHKSQCNLWDDIRDNRLIWVKDFNEWFQITVSIDETNDTVKTITGTALCESELSQIIIVNTEINTEEDIGRDNYKPTVFYNPDDTSASLLHRLLKKAPHYTIGHVDETLRTMQRTFSISETTIYDELMGEISEEFGCLFLFDSSTRTINVYDLMNVCSDCGYRGDYTDKCPECGSTDISTGYGKDTTILVDSENLAESIILEGKADELKNYFRVCGGDDIIDSYIAACNPSGTNYIYAFSNFDKEDMSDELVQKIEEYQNLLDSKSEEYQNLLQKIFTSIDKQLELKSTMMPTIEHAETTAQKELAKITWDSLTPVAVADENILKNLTVQTANNAVLAMAKCLVNSTVYKITITSSSFGTNSSGNKIWKGKFKLVNNSDEEDAAENDADVSCGINADYETYIENKIQKVVDRDDVYLIDMFENKTELSAFKNALKDYCLERLKSFENAYQSVIDVLVENKMNDASAETYNNLYKNYYDKLCAIQAETNVRSGELNAEVANYESLEKKKVELNNEFNLSNFLGDELFKEFCSYRREDTYKNDNYISDGLTDTETFKKAKELLSTAEKELVKASTLQYALSSTLFNLLAMKEFSPIVNDFEIGNWIRIRVDDRIFRLRLIYYTIDFIDLQKITVEFSDVLETANGLSDIESLMKQTQTMATNFNYVVHQSSQGENVSKKINKILDEGLNAALTSIKNSDKQEIVIDNHGILGRSYDDIFNDYSPEQFKFINNLLVFTKDNWASAESALGKISYYDPVTGEDVADYGLIAKAVIAGFLMGNKIVGGEIYSENYKKNTSGSHMNLSDGSFEFAGGKLNYDGKNLNYSGNVTISNTKDVSASLSQDLGIKDKNGNLLLVTEEKLASEYYTKDDADKKISSSIKQTADSITSTVASSQKIWDTSELNIVIKHYGFGNPNNVIPTSTSTDGEYYLDQTNGILYYSSNMYNYWTVASNIITSGRLKSINDEFSTSIEQTDKSIKLIQDGVCEDGKVNLSSKISLEEGDIEFKGRNFIFESVNDTTGKQGTFSVDSSNLKIGASNGVSSIGESYTSILNNGTLMSINPKKDIVLTYIYGYDENGYDDENGGSPKMAFRVNNDAASVSKEMGFTFGTINNGQIWYEIVGKKDSSIVTHKFNNAILTGISELSAKNLSVSGTKNRIVKTETKGTVALNAFETAEAYFSDIGSGEILDNEQCRINIEPIFAETIDLTKPYQVFITNTNEHPTSYIEKHEGYFIVHGETGATFDWMLTAKQKDYANIRLERRN